MEKDNMGDAFSPRPHATHRTALRRFSLSVSVAIALAGCAKEPPVDPEVNVQAWMALGEELSGWNDDAQAGEAGTATTAKTGVVHEHAIGNADAPKG